MVGILKTLRNPLNGTEPTLALVLWTVELDLSATHYTVVLHRASHYN